MKGKKISKGSEKRKRSKSNFGCAKDFFRMFAAEETLQEAGIYEIPVHEAERRQNRKLPGVVSVCQIPYEGSDLCFYLVLYANGKLEMLPEVWSPQPYIPRKARKHFGDVEKELLIVQFEFEALGSCDQGQFAIAFAGLGFFSQQRILPDVFNQIALFSRKITIVPCLSWLDSVEISGRYKTDTLNYATLANMLNERGAKASIDYIKKVNKDGTLDLE